MVEGAGVEAEEGGVAVVVVVAAAKIWYRPVAVYQECTAGDTLSLSIEIATDYIRTLFW